MAKRRIIWSNRARIRLFEILKYYAERNKSKTYSKKLYQRFTNKLSILFKQPDIGITTEIIDVRGLIIDDFILFYENDHKNIVIHSIWDSKQNPDDLRIK